MKLINYGEKILDNLTLALGYFDAVHKGHIAVLDRAVSIAKSKGFVPTALIFTGGKSDADVFTLSERADKIFACGIKNIIVKPLDRAFMAKTKEEFLTELSSLYSIGSVVSGVDFTFGKGALGNVQTLREFFGEDKVYTERLLSDNSGKFSSTKIKEALSFGDIKLANFYLGSNYFISGEVVKGKGLGNTLDFPTANITLSSEKFKIKQGVYKTFVLIDGVKYKAITNYGTQPTVLGNDIVVETYIDGFSGDLYGKNLTVYFDEFLRDVKKFSSLEELKEQLIKDKGSLND